VFILRGDVIDNLLGKSQGGNIISIKILVLVDIQAKVRGTVQRQIASILVLAIPARLGILVELLTVLVATKRANVQSSSPENSTAGINEIIALCVVVHKANKVRIGILHNSGSMPINYRKSSEKTRHRIDLDVAIKVGMAELLALALGLAHAIDVIVDIIHKTGQDAAQSNVIGVGGHLRAITAVADFGPLGTVVTVNVEPKEVHVVGVLGVIIPIKSLSEINPINPHISTDDAGEFAVVDEE
jgi:hypothetical protein